MAYSATTLVKLQRLARMAKKELNLDTKLSSEAGVGLLVVRASMVQENSPMMALYEDFKSTLTVEDEDLLSKSGAIQFSNSSASTAQEDHLSPMEEAHLHERVYRGTVIHDAAPEALVNNTNSGESAHRKQRMYRGVVIEDDVEDVAEIVQQVSVEDAIQARIQAEVDAQVKLKMAALDQAKIPKEKLIKFPQSENPIKPIKPIKPMRKKVGMYRGQPIYEDVK